MAIDAQRGQAVVEALAGLALLGLVGTAVISVGRFQWHGLEAAHAARAHAFRYAIGDRAPAVLARAPASGRTAPFVQPAVAHMQVLRAAHAADFPGPGGSRAAALRRELGLEDRGMVRVDAAVHVSPHRHHGQGLVLRRHTAILSDAGHADSDARAQQRIAASRTAWGDAARASLGPARQAASLLKRLDQGWGRAAPDLDWLTPWSDLVPADRVKLGASAAGRRP